MQAPLHIACIVRLCCSVYVTIPRDAASSVTHTSCLHESQTDVFVLYACSWDLGTHKLISELECHSEKASQRFDQHGWKDDKTTFNSFEFWHWLINRHEKTMCWNENSIIFGELLPLANAENNRVWRRSEALLFAAGAALSGSESAATVSENERKLHLRREKKSYKRRTKNSSETLRRSKRRFHFTPGWLWREIR